MQAIRRLLIIVTVLYVFLAAVPALDRDVNSLLGIDVFYLFDIDVGIGPRKLHFMTALALAIGALVAAHWFWERRSGQAKRTLSHAACLLIIGGTWVQFQYLAAMRSHLVREARFDYGNLARLRVQTFAPVDNDEVFSTDALRAAQAGSFHDLAGVAHGRYLAMREELRARWHIRDEARLEAIFYMNLVSRMWGYGDAQDPSKATCITSQNSDWPDLAEPKRIAVMMRSQSACCSDFTALLKLFLDHEGIENQVVGTYGHVLNEAHVGSRWITLDPSANILYEASWNELLSAWRPDVQLNVTFFPLAGMIESSPTYRSHLAPQRYGFLLKALNGDLHPTHKSIESYN